MVDLIPIPEREEGLDVATVIDFGIDHTGEWGAEVNSRHWIVMIDSTRKGRLIQRTKGGRQFIEARNVIGRLMGATPVTDDTEAALARVVSLLAPTAYAMVFREFEV